jgi:hypothetical protein
MQLAEEVREVNELNGWFDVDRTFGDDVALLHSEVSEAFEEHRDGASPTNTRYSMKMDEEGQRLAALYGLAEDFIFPDDEELYTERCRALQRDHPELFKPEGIPSELADVFIRLVDTAGRYGIDLDAAVAEKLVYNRGRGYRHGGKVL